VNGDDILFRTNADQDKIWLQVVEDLGFELSVGKNYVHKDFLMINSTAFLYRNKSFRPIEFFNVGLLVGQSKLFAASGTHTSDQDLPLDALYTKVLVGACDKYRAHRRFLHYHVEMVKRMTHNGEYSLFAHPQLGGLGLPLFPELAPHVKFTSFQRKLGSFLRSSTRQSKFEGCFSSHLSSFLQLQSKNDGLTRIPMYKDTKCHEYSYIPSFIGPLPREVVRAESHDQTWSELLTYNLWRQEKPVLQLTKPDRTLLDAFRNYYPIAPLKTKKLTSFPFILVENNPILTSEYLDYIGASNSESGLSASEFATEALDLYGDQVFLDPEEEDPSP
jgi:hypothetical protein